jgi:hypothetical protein
MCGEPSHHHLTHSSGRGDDGRRVICCTAARRVSWRATTPAPEQNTQAASLPLHHTCPSFCTSGARTRGCPP